MTDSGWVGHSAAEIAAAVAAGKVTAAEVAGEHLAQIAARDAEVGAFVRVRAAAALAEAEAVDARPDLAELPLAGVPVSIKDSIGVTGEPMRTGSAATARGPREEDHPLVARLRAAGAVVVGLTNLPELAIYPFTDSAYGITRNPWDLSRTAGGSSGGAAASVAAGMVPLAHGTDGLGSVRIPAAACGLFGIKPGPGLLPGGGGWFGLSESGPLGTTVADAALMLGLLAGRSYSLDSPGPLRIAVSDRAPGPGITVASGCVAAVHESSALLAGLGHCVEDAGPPYPGWLSAVLLSYWLAAPASEAGPNLAEMEARTRQHVKAGGRSCAAARPARRTASGCGRRWRRSGSGTTSWSCRRWPSRARGPPLRQPVVAPQRCHGLAVLPHDQRVEPGGLPGGHGPGPRGRPARRGATGHHPRPRGPAAVAGSRAGEGPPLAAPRPRLRDGMN